MKRPACLQSSLRPAQQLRSTHGFSLIELMVAMTISLVLLAGLVTLVINADKNQSKLMQLGAANDNGRYAIGQLDSDLRLAGYYGLYFEVTEPPPGSGPVDPCSLNLTDMENGLSMPVQGYTGLNVTTDPLPNCVPTGEWMSNTPILVVRRASSTAVALATFQATAGQYYFQSTYNGYCIGTSGSLVGTLPSCSNGGGAFDSTPDHTGFAPVIRQYEEHIYFISPCLQPTNGSCSSTSDNGQPIPTLKRVELTVGGWSQPEPVAAGVQQMQIDYGVDSNGDGSPDTYEDPSYLAFADWGKVVSVDVHLLVRSNKELRGWTDNKTYDLGPECPACAEKTVPAAKDAYARHVYSELVRLTNVDQRLLP